MDLKQWAGKGSWELGARVVTWAGFWGATADGIRVGHVAVSEMDLGGMSPGDQSAPGSWGSVEKGRGKEAMEKPGK